MLNKLKLSIFSLLIVLSNQTLDGKENDSKILVVGGTGRVGSEIVKVLSKNQFDVTVMSRSKTSRISLEEFPVHYVKGDVLIEDHVADVFNKQNYDVVINAIAKVADDKNPHAIMNSGINYTVIRTGIIIYDDTPATGNAILSSNEDIVGLVTRKDLARLTVGCIMKSRCKNKVFHALDESLMKKNGN